MSDKKEKYVVTRPNTTAAGKSLEVGDEVSLTETQAKNLVNKVEPARAYKASKKDGDKLKALEAENAELKAQLAKK